MARCFHLRSTITLPPLFRWDLNPPLTAQGKVHHINMYQFLWNNRNAPLTVNRGCRTLGNAVVQSSIESNVVVEIWYWLGSRREYPHQINDCFHIQQQKHWRFNGIVYRRFHIEQRQRAATIHYCGAHSKSLSSHTSRLLGFTTQSLGILVLWCSTISQLDLCECKVMKFYWMWTAINMSGSVCYTRWLSA